MMRGRKDLLRGCTTRTCSLVRFIKCVLLLTGAFYKIPRSALSAPITEAELEEANGLVHNFPVPRTAHHTDRVRGGKPSADDDDRIRILENQGGAIERGLVE